MTDRKNAAKRSMETLFSCVFKGIHIIQKRMNDAKKHDEVNDVRAS